MAKPLLLLNKNYCNFFISCYLDIKKLVFFVDVNLILT